MSLTQTKSLAEEGAALAAGDDTARRGWLSGFYARHDQGVIGASVLIVTLAAWQLFGGLGIVNKAFTSYPSQIADVGYHFLGTGTGRHDLLISGQEYIVGLALGVVVGVILGILVGWYRVMYSVLNPFVTILNSTPLIALAPLFVLWLGIGIDSKVALVFLSCLVPVIVTTSTGVRTVEGALVNVAKVFKANGFQILWTLVLPGCVPAILAGVRLALGFGLIGMVVGEIVASTAGIGYLIESAGNQFETPLLFVGIAIIAITGMILSWILQRVERHVGRWRI